MLDAMDLRDRFAARFAASLAVAVADPAELARRAYDLAEAMLAERARRVDADEGRAIAMEPRRAPPVLLDEPEPMDEPDLGYEGEELDPSCLEPPYDPTWDLEARWSAEPPGDARAPRPPGPGLARAQPGDDADRDRRSA
jgi:hypothetical protein